jgi:hypothetical protein
MMSQLSPLIEFNDTYIDRQVAATQAANDKAGIKPSPQQWGLGTIYNALTFPTNMGGSSARTPARYHRLVYQTGKAMPDFLRDTNEMMHASVRARYKCGGVGSDLKTPYEKDTVLKGWTLGTKKDENGKEAWVWAYGPPDGDDVPAYHKEMLEAPLSELEKKILQRDEAMLGRLFPNELD